MNCQPIFITYLRHCRMNLFAKRACMPAVFDAVALILHALVQSLAFICARPCIHLCKVLHTHVQHLYHTMSLETLFPFIARICQSQELRLFLLGRTSRPLPSAFAQLPEIAILTRLLAAGLFKRLVRIENLLQQSLKALPELRL